MGSTWIHFFKNTACMSSASGRRPTNQTEPRALPPHHHYALPAPSPVPAWICSLHAIQKRKGQWQSWGAISKQQAGAELWQNAMPQAAYLSTRLGGQFSWTQTIKQRKQVAFTHLSILRQWLFTVSSSMIFWEFSPELRMKSEPLFSVATEHLSNLQPWTESPGLSLATKRLAAASSISPSFPISCYQQGQAEQDSPPTHGKSKKKHLSRSSIFERNHFKQEISSSPSIFRGHVKLLHPGSLT